MSELSSYTEASIACPEWFLGNGNRSCVLVIEIVDCICFWSNLLIHGRIWFCFMDKPLAVWWLVVTNHRNDKKEALGEQKKDSSFVVYSFNYHLVLSKRRVRFQDVMAAKSLHGLKKVIGQMNGEVVKSLLGTVKQKNSNSGETFSLHIAGGLKDVLCLHCFFWPLSKRGYCLD